MYKTTVALQAGMKELGPFPTFAEAFVAMVDGVNGMLKEGTCHQMLETAVYIERMREGWGNVAIGFYEAKDLAYELGLMADSKLVDPLPCVDETRAEQFFESRRSDQIFDLLKIGREFLELTASRRKH